MINLQKTYSIQGHYARVSLPLHDRKTFFILFVLFYFPSSVYDQLRFFPCVVLFKKIQLSPPIHEL